MMHRTPWLRLDEIRSGGPDPSYEFKQAAFQAVDMARQSRRESGDRSMTAWWLHVAADARRKSECA